MVLTTRLEQAIKVSATAHRHQARKGGIIPYIIHPFSVMLIASDATDDEDTLIACLFHDILEDVPHEYTATEMANDFGQRVVDIVKGVTNDPNIKNWHVRSQAYLDHIITASDESVIVCGADKIHNLMSTLTDYEVVGDEVWKRFSTGKEHQLWWYSSVLAVLKERNVSQHLTKKLSELVGQLELILRK